MRLRKGAGFAAGGCLLDSPLRQGFQPLPQAPTGAPAWRVERICGGAHGGDATVGSSQPRGDIQSVGGSSV